MSVKLNKQETNTRVLIDKRRTHLVKDINVNETRVVEEKQKTGQDMRTSERARTEQLKVAAIKSEPRLVDPISKENIAVEVLQTVPVEKLSQLENLTDDAENSSENSICMKNKTLETSGDHGRDLITSEASENDDLRKKRKRGEGGGLEDDRTQIGKKIKTEEKNIKEEAVQRLKLLQKGVKILFICDTSSRNVHKMNFSDTVIFAGKSNGTFVQCSRAKCSKWRFLPEFEDPALVSAAKDYICTAGKN